jgi:Tol biopolymer transport system component
VILYDGRSVDPLMRVSAAGGVSQPVVFSEGKDKGTPGTVWPEFLPDGRHFLYGYIEPASPEMTLMVGDLDSTITKSLFKTTSRVQYAEPGFLLFVRDRTLVAQPFDVQSLALQGDPVPLGEGLGSDTLGLASFSASRNGVLVFKGGELSGTRLLWVDRAGKEAPALEAVGEYADVSLSPDGTRLAYDLGGGANRGDLWIRDLARGVSSRFTFDPALETVPQWSPDGRRIVYTIRGKSTDLYIKDASGTRDPEPLLVNAEEKYVSDWSSDGKYLLFTSRVSDGTGWNIWGLPLDGDRKPFPIVKTQFGELWATFSPDGKYIAYQSNESGRPEIYVHEFPEARNKWQVSTDGGTEPYWRRDGRELFYRAGSRLMAVPVSTSATFTAGTPVRLFEARFASVVARGRYRPTPDGQRFLVLAALARDVEQPAAVVLNWTSGLKP